MTIPSDREAMLALDAIGMFFRVLRGHSYLAEGYQLEVAKADYDKARAGYDFLRAALTPDTPREGE